MIASGSAVFPLRMTPLKYCKKTSAFKPESISHSFHKCDISAFLSRFKALGEDTSPPSVFKTNRLCNGLLASLITNKSSLNRRAALLSSCIKEQTPFSPKAAPCNPVRTDFILGTIDHHPIQLGGLAKCTYPKFWNRDDLKS